MIDFIVTDAPTLFIYNHAVYPNPVVNVTNFYFEHDREDEDLEVTVLIYNGRGEVITDKAYLFEAASRSIEIPWAAQSYGGQQYLEGIYFYRLLVKSKIDNATKEISGKLVIRN